MFEATKYDGTREENYRAVLARAGALIEGEDDLIANLANLSALLGDFLEDINWVGYYLMKNGELVLGPFQGKPACVHISIGNGVCGTAVKENATQLVRDVHKFPGHIACDSASNSEIVVPIRKDGEIVGVLDIDSPLFSRFDETDRMYLEQFARITATVF